MKRSYRFISFILAAFTVLSVVSAGMFSAGAEDANLAGVGDDSHSKIYFDVNPVIWKNFKTITCYVYEYPSNEPIFTWGSKKGYMTDEGDGIWSFDFDAKGIQLQSEKLYGVIFTADWDAQTDDLIMTTECLGDCAYLTGDHVENPTDCNLRSAKAAWKNSMYGSPIRITSIGNVVGDSFWPNESPYSVFVDFLISDEGLSIAVMYNGKTKQETIDDTAETLGLTEEEKLKACDEAGVSGASDGAAAPPSPSVDGDTEATADPAHGSPKTGDRSFMYLCIAIILILSAAFAAAPAAFNLSKK